MKHPETCEISQTAARGKVDELAMLVRQLVHSLRKASPGNDLADRVLDYLKRHGLTGTVLRGNSAFLSDDVPAGMKPSKASEAVGTSPSANIPNNVPVLTEQDATLLNQAIELLEDLSIQERRRGNDSTAEGATCSANAVQRLGSALLAEISAPAAQAVERIVHLRVDRKRRIYVAGPMTGLPEFNFPAFNSAADKLRAEEWHVENPAEHGHIEGADWADYLRWDISRIATCGAIYLLPGWEGSKGATLEVSIAKALGMQFILAPGEAPQAQADAREEELLAFAVSEIRRDWMTDSELLDAMEQKRIAVVPEYEGPWDAEVYNGDEKPNHRGTGSTPREAIRAAIAAAKGE